MSDQTHAERLAVLRTKMLEHLDAALACARETENGPAGANLVGMVVPKGQTARLAYITEFIEQAKASGSVKPAIERSRLPGHQGGTGKNKLKGLPNHDTPRSLRS